MHWSMWLLKLASNMSGHFGFSCCTFLKIEARNCKSCISQSQCGRNLGLVGFFKCMWDCGCWYLLTSDNCVVQLLQLGSCGILFSNFACNSKTAECRVKQTETYVSEVYPVSGIRNACAVWMLLTSRII